jgi:hypothetical protein
MLHDLVVYDGQLKSTNSTPGQVPACSVEVHGESCASVIDFIPRARFNTMVLKYRSACIQSMRLIRGKEADVNNSHVCVFIIYCHRRVPCRVLLRRVPYRALFRSEITLIC